MFVTFFLCQREFFWVNYTQQCSHNVSPSPETVLKKKEINKNRRPFRFLGHRPCTKYIIFDGKYRCIHTEKFVQSSWLSSAEPKTVEIWLFLRSRMHEMSTPGRKKNSSERSKRKDRIKQKRKQQKWDALFHWCVQVRHACLIFFASFCFISLFSLLFRLLWRYTENLHIFFFHFSLFPCWQLCVRVLLELSLANGWCPIKSNLDLLLCHFTLSCVCLAIYSFFTCLGLSSWSFNL